MANTSLQVMGLVLGIAGWGFGVLVCAAPWWRVSAFVGDELVVSQVLSEGLWMTCLSERGRLQCKVYDSGLALSGSAQMCRGLCVLSLFLCLLAVPLSVTGLKCTRGLGDAHEAKARMAQVGAVLFLLAAFLFLVPVCWTAHTVIRDFYDPSVAAPLKRELGPALYLGWGVTALMLVGGAVLYLGSASPGAPAIPVFGQGGKANPPSTAESKPEKVFV
ncbi:claudin-9 [Pimephales promelas]|uniref:claudin-9 n=1 Tax=Pimephales promelas TaxID=90988 RepID=UPI001955DE4A|nr:claudin-9 [Pimephales promelas]XP_039503832.1 claudin-9 [Pimephales promelas]KAG1955848.1 claudin-5 [Pimephales promelas]KAG1955849.1 claudin-5 [Pimephales promelas]KAG1955850.1 claudin-5 [Pimephales promelas]KAG1955851.1 claudin-5 [Pimephales promelas]KAG1955852.1 claudin-5 [Pimephales promelas]